MHPVSSHPYDKRVIEQAHELIYKLLDRITKVGGAPKPTPCPFSLGTHCREVGDEQ
jgi:hypothetical protein